MLSAQFAEFSSPCQDDSVTTGIEAVSDHSSHTENTTDHHCHQICAQCHSVILVPSLISFDPKLDSNSISFFITHFPLNDYQLSVDRPPAFVV